MTMPDFEKREVFDVAAERTRFRKYAEKKRRFNGQTYKTDLGIDNRTDRIFGTFARMLRGRGRLSETTKAAEKRCLHDTVRDAIVCPLLRSDARILHSQASFDTWYGEVVELLKTRCPMQWDRGPTLTVGMIQKIVDLHCKSMWTLEAVPDRDAKCFHATIDSTTLGHLLGKPGLPWTQLDSFGTYLELQWEIRQLGLEQGTYPVALECWTWSRYRPSGEID